MKRVLITLSLLTLFAASAQPVSSAAWQGEHNGIPTQVTVIARGHSIPATIRRTARWWRWGNTLSDAYLFSFDEDRGVDLILDFSRAPSGVPLATLYQPTRRDRFRVAAAPNLERGYTLPETVTPRFTVRPVRGGWWVSGKPTFDLEAQRFEPFDGTFLEYRSRIRAAAPGMPLWEQSRLVNDVSPSSAYPRYNANLRADPRVPFRLAVPLMPTWPYLSLTPERDHWGPNRPVVFEADLKRLGTFWIGFHIAGSYQINSLSLPPHTDFEAPFAFYRFDPEADKYANLVIRSDVWPASSPFGPPIERVPRTAVRMTWTGQQADLWRYSLTVLGNHKMTERVRIGSTRVRAVPYESYPSWVTEKTWKLATFVEATEGEGGSEGIYDYSLEDNYPMSFWAQGLRPRFPDTFYAPYLSARGRGPRELKPGMRGEYSSAYRHKPRLYMSPIDGRVHLLHADGGLWNLGEAGVLRVANLDGDAYLDAWWRETLPARSPRAQGGVLEEALYRIGDLLLYTGPTGVRVRQSPFAPVLAGLPVPKDRQTWRTFLERSAFPQEARSPLDLASWWGDFAGASVALQGATLERPRSTSSGLQFDLEVDEGFAVEGALTLPIFSDLTPGRYIIRYDRSQKVWSREVSTPAKLTATLTTSRLATFVPGSLELRVANNGSHSLSAEATLHLGGKIIKRWQPLRLDGHGVWRETVPWTPEQPGQLQARLKVGGHTLPLGVAEVSRAARVGELSAFFLPLEGHLKVAATFLAVAVLAGLSALWASWWTS